MWPLGIDCFLRIRAIWYVEKVITDILVLIALGYHAVEIHGSFPGPYKLVQSHTHLCSYTVQSTLS